MPLDHARLCSKKLRALLFAHQPFFIAADCQRSQLFTVPRCSRISKGADVQLINSTAYFRNAVFKETSNCFMRYSLSLPIPHISICIYIYIYIYVCLYIYIYVYIHTHRVMIYLSIYTNCSKAYLKDKEHMVITLWDLEKPND